MSMKVQYSYVPQTHEKIILVTLNVGNHYDERLHHLSFSF